MKTKPGHIEIKDKEIRFVYHKLEKPDFPYFGGHPMLDHDYAEELEAYEALRREVKVKNAVLNTTSRNDITLIGEILIYPNEKNDIIWNPEVDNNQPCEAEIENRIATITKIL